MYEIVDIEAPTRVIVHLKEEEGFPGRLVHYQTLIDPTVQANMSPSGDFIRLNHGENSELNGWFKIESLVIDEVLEELVEQEKVANG